MEEHLIMKKHTGKLLGVLLLVMVALQDAEQRMREPQMEAVQLPRPKLDSVKQK